MRIVTVIILFFLYVGTVFFATLFFQKKKTPPPAAGSQSTTYQPMGDPGATSPAASTNVIVSNKTQVIAPAVSTTPKVGALPNSLQWKQTVSAFT